MKTMIKGFCLIIGFILCVVIVSTVIIDFVKQDEFNTIVGQAFQQTQRVIYDERYKIESNEEYLAEFTQNLVRSSSSCKNFTINVYGIDYEKGLLDVEVKTKLKYINGNEKELSIRKLNIIDVIKK